MKRGTRIPAKFAPPYTVMLAGYPRPESKVWVVSKTCQVAVVPEGPHAVKIAQRIADLCNEATGTRRAKR